MELENSENFENFEESGKSEVSEVGIRIGDFELIGIDALWRYVRAGT